MDCNMKIAWLKSENAKLEEELEKQKQMRYNVLGEYHELKLAMKEIYAIVSSGPSSEKSELSDAIEDIAKHALTYWDRN